MDSTRTRTADDRGRPEPTEPRAYFDRDGAADYLGVGLTTIKTLLRDGSLPYAKIGRRTIVSRGALDAYVAALVASRRDGVRRARR